MGVSLKKDNSQLLITVAQGSEVIGYLVIDSTIGGGSCGGVRVMPDIDEAEIRGLARAMTLKFGFLGLPQGGAKAGVIGDPKGPLQERRQRLATFGQTIAPLLLGRLYTPTTDMGTDNNDVRYMLKAAGVQVKRRELRSERSGYYTAVSVFTSLKQATYHLALRLSECSAAIEGFGKVGSSLGILLDAANCRVVAISTSTGAIYNAKGLDMRRLSRLVAEKGSQTLEQYADAEHIDRTALLELPVDLLCPCARPNSLHSDNADRIAARIICSGANNPITPEAERVLFERGVLCLPCFVTNSGGTLGGTMEFASVKREQIETFIQRHIGERVAWLLKEADRRHEIPREVATSIALSRFQNIQRNASHPSPLDRLFRTGLELYRRGLIPSHIVGPLSLPYFERLMRGGSHLQYHAITSNQET